jgi:hypothetical protein
MAAAQAQARCSVGAGRKPCGGSRASEETEDAADGVNHTEPENDSLGTTRTTRRRRGKGRPRYRHLAMFVDISLILLISLIRLMAYIYLLTILMLLILNTLYHTYIS